MPNRYTASATLYLSLTVFVIGWWLLAFGPTLTPISSVPSAQQPLQTTITTSSPYLHPLSRQKIHDALLGDTELMLALMAEWDTEAQLLSACGTAVAERLPNHNYLQAQLLGRIIMARGRGILSHDAPAPKVHVVADDTGQGIQIPTNYRRFLPQTYVSASFLLALSPPEQIVALPKGLRDYTQLYPTELLETVPLDSSPYHTEMLYRSRPDVAFVAAYTLPATRQALLDKGIKLFTISRINTLDEVQDALIRVGDVVGKPEEAQLLSFFMDATICALNNRLIATNAYGENKPKDILYLNYFTKFSTPTPRTLTGSLLRRLGINAFPSLEEGTEQCWQIPLEQERIVHLNPKTIVLSATNGAEVRNLLLRNPAFQHIPAVQHQNIFTVDQVVQDFPSQFTVLAYFDLVKTLLDAQP